MRAPTSLKPPRVPVMRPNVVALLATLKTRLGSVKLKRVKGLLTSQRNWKRTLSQRRQVFEREACAHTRPGDSKVLRPRVPGVNGAGYANAAAFRYGFCAANGSRFGPMLQPDVTALGEIWSGRCCMGSQA